MLSDKSRALLRGVHQDLVRVIERAANEGPPFVVTEGLRTVERQRKLVAKGASKTMNSRHLTGHAVDICPLDEGKPSYSWPLYYPLAAAVKAAAKKEGVPIEWGGDWSKFKDGPHWQLPFKQYPKTARLGAAVDIAKPMTIPTDRQAGIKKAGLLSSASLSGAGLSDAASQIAPLTDVSDILKWVFVGLTVASVAYGLWVWWKAD